MISLLIRSYDKDLEWLDYSIKSMRQNLTGISEKVLVIPEDTDYHSDFFDIIYRVKELHTFGYIAQQLDKLRAYEFVSNKYVLHSDSDCVYYKPFDANQMLIDGKILLYRTNYHLLRNTQAKCWQAITKNIIGYKPHYEYMRAFPIMHFADIGKDIFDQALAYSQTINDTKFSEFNAIGGHIERTNNLNYILTEDLPPNNAAKQYWSWGGITDDISKEMQVLKE